MFETELAHTEKRMKKSELLKELLSGLGSLAVAFSGGVDSTFLLRMAREALGDKAVAITAVSDFFPARERSEAADFCAAHGIRQLVVPVRACEIEGFAENPRDRCYLCKKSLFRKFLDTAAAAGIPWVAEGSNLDDTGDYRPGLRAIEELGIRSPLREVGLTKAEIRELSRDLELPTWDKPSYACLASRFPYGETITPEKLGMVDRAEQLLLELGFRQHRVRIHGAVARIELLPEDFPRLMEPEIRQRVYDSLRADGFAYVTLDLRGYRTGSMNELLTEQEKKQYTPGSADQTGNQTL